MKNKLINIHVLNADNKENVQDNLNYGDYQIF